MSNKVVPSDGLFLKDMISEFGGEVGCRDKMEGSIGII